MSIPLDRLYYYLEDLCSEDILIYRWYPHGSKKLTDLGFIDKSKFAIPLFENLSMPVMICHDQEPLNYNFYTQEEFLSVVKEQAEQRKLTQPRLDWCYSEEFMKIYAASHLRTKILNPMNLHDLILLCHSERNSDQLKLYEQNGFLGVYYWAHAIIARDWFRYAERDSKLDFDQSQVKFDFLIYNRAWQGTREYRLKFSEMVLDNDLLSKCLIKFNSVDNHQHYTQHKFMNPALQVLRSDLEQHFAPNTSTGHFSADYDSGDYRLCAIEVVLETLFDDTRNHLTEKALRPIACGRPFVLASTPNSLVYLRDYGFKTFDGLINEQYDTIADPAARLQAIVDEMQRISQLPQGKKQALWTELDSIAKFNKQHFFSEKFHNQITDEFVQNFNSALSVCKDNATGKWWKLFFKFPSFNQPASEVTMRIDQLVEDLNRARSLK